MHIVKCSSFKRMFILIMHKRGTSYKIIGLWCYSFFHICFAYFDVHYTHDIVYCWGYTTENREANKDYILSKRLFMPLTKLPSSHYFPNHKGILSNLFGLKTMQIIIMLIFSKILHSVEYYITISLPLAIYQNSCICIQHAAYSRSK